MTSENVTEAETVEPSGPKPSRAVDDRLFDELVSRAQAEGLQLTGEGGLPQQLTKQLLESALEGGITDRLGYDEHDPAGRRQQPRRNSCEDRADGRRSGGDIRAPGPSRLVRAEDLKERQKRLTGVDDVVISLSAKGLPTGEVQAHLP